MTDGDYDQLRTENAMLRNEVESLRAELARIKASKVGVKLLPCKCGCNRRSQGYRPDIGMICFQCRRCGFRSPFAKGSRAAREAWNKAVME